MHKAEDKNAISEERVARQRQRSHGAMKGLFVPELAPFREHQVRRVFPKKSSVNTSVRCREKRQGRVAPHTSRVACSSPEEAGSRGGNHPQVTRVIRGSPKSNPTKGPGTELSRLVLQLLKEFLDEKQSRQRRTELTLELSRACALMASGNGFGNGHVGTGTESQVQKQHPNQTLSSLTRPHQILPNSARITRSQPTLPHSTTFNQILPNCIRTTESFQSLPDFTPDLTQPGQPIFNQTQPENRPALAFHHSKFVSSHEK